jgi:hypothetical protein
MSSLPADEALFRRCGEGALCATVHLVHPFSGEPLIDAVSGKTRP